MYKFNQFRRTQFNSYLTPLTFQLSTSNQKSELSHKAVFKETYINLEGGNVLKHVDSTGTKMKSYFIRFKIYKNTTLPQNVNLLLENDERVQKIETIQVEPGNATEGNIYEIIFSPNSAYDNIHFSKERAIEEYSLINEDGTYGTPLKIEVLNLYEINNVISHLDSAIENKGRLKQIGVQAEPGLHMCIDGESIKVGKSGIYEINNGISIQFLGFLIEPNDNKFFLLDYQY